jgi:uroporphyrinogen decarboxylase
MAANSRERISDLVRGTGRGAVDSAALPWTFDFGSCKGINFELLAPARRHLGLTASFAETFDYDIWIALDPDRLHHDRLPHVDDALRSWIPENGIQCMIPLRRAQDFDYMSLYRAALRDPVVQASVGGQGEQGSFDAFGLYYYAWPGHAEYLNFLSPLERVEDLSLIGTYPLPIVDPEGFRYFRREVAYIHSRGKMCASWSGSLYELSWYLRGRERILYDYYDRPDLVDLLVERIADFVERLTRQLVAEGVDVLCFYDDLGTQGSLFISPQIFRRFYKPHYKRIWQAAKATNPNTLIFLHACGNVSEIIPDLVECGLDILNPVQPEAMNPAAVSRRYGRDLALWGTVSVQHTFPFGTREDIDREVRERVRGIVPQAPLILSPANTLGPDTPPANLAYFIEACQKYCRLGQ